MNVELPDASTSFVTSADGARIAYRRQGRGPELLIIGGALSDHSSYLALSDALFTSFSVTVWDRRGRGQSSRVLTGYAPEREVEDVSALLAACGAASGDNVAVFGHSSGAALALRAVAAGLPIQQLVLGDPPYSPLDAAADMARAEHAQQADTLRSLVAARSRGETAARQLAEAMPFARLETLPAPLHALDATDYAPRIASFIGG